MRKYKKNKHENKEQMTNDKYFFNESKRKLQELKEKIEIKSGKLL